MALMHEITIIIIHEGRDEKKNYKVSRRRNKLLVRLEEWKKIFNDEQHKSASDS